MPQQVEVDGLVPEGTACRFVKDNSGGIKNDQYNLGMSKYSRYRLILCRYWVKIKQVIVYIFFVNRKDSYGIFICESSGRKVGN